MKNGEKREAGKKCDTAGIGLYERRCAYTLLKFVSHVEKLLEFDFFVSTFSDFPPRMFADQLYGLISKSCSDLKQSITQHLEHSHI